MKQPSREVLRWPLDYCRALRSSSYPLSESMVTYTTVATHLFFIKNFYDID